MSLTGRNTEKEQTHPIEIKIKRINQLFNSLDPSPFLEKDLDDDACEYIVSSVSEHHMGAKQKIVIHMPLDQQKKVSPHEIEKALHNFFEYKKMLAEKSIRLKLEEGQLSFIVGLSFLAICLFIGSLISKTYDSFFSTIIVEGPVIGGWVAMWKPISNILYDWWPLNKEKRIFDKISKMRVEFKFS